MAPPPHPDRLARAVTLVRAHLQELDFQPGPGVGYGGLAAYPLRGSTLLDAPILAGTTALQQGSLELREMRPPTVDGILARNRDARRAIYVQVGTLLEGGLQNRVTTGAALVGAGREHRLNTRCVERDRWSAGNSGRSFSRALTSPSGLRRQLLLEGSSSPLSQEDLWRDVDQTLTAARVHSPTADLLAACRRPAPAPPAPLARPLQASGGIVLLGSDAAIQAFESTQVRSLAGEVADEVLTAMRLQPNLERGAFEAPALRTTTARFRELREVLLASPLRAEEHDGCLRVRVETSRAVLEAVVDGEIVVHLMVQAS